MEEKKRNNRITIALIGIFVILSFLVGVTYAYFAATAQSDTVTITSGRLEIVFTDGQLINATNIEPINESDILTKATKKSFSVAKASDSNDMYARIDLTDLVVSNNFQDYDLKWALYEGSTKITTGSFVTTSDGSDSINMATNVLINSTTPKNYSLYIWIQETGVDQTNLVDGSLTGKITVTGEKDKLNTLASKILSETPQTNPTFSATSTDKGLFVQKDDSTKSNYGFPTYYYKGNITNNYVSFGTYKSNLSNCVVAENDKVNCGVVANENDNILWRIVRINEDGSLKLAMEKDISTFTTYNVANNNSNYIGGETKTAIDNFFDSTFSIDEKKNVIIGNFCLYNGDYTETANAVILNSEPTIVCTNGSTILNTKPGMLSAMDIVFAGGISFAQSTSSNYKIFLDNNTPFWTLTPFFDTHVFLLAKHPTSIYINYSTPVQNNSASPRLVINLKPDVLVASGNGTESSPYVIE